MMTHGHIMDRLSLLINDHQRIKEMSIQVQFLLDYRINGTDAWADDLLSEIRKLAQFTAQHMKREEDLLFPILKEMYASDEEIVKYIQEEHQQINDRLSSLILSGPFDASESKEDIHEMIREQLEHMFKEEHALYPLIRNHFNRIRH